MSSATNGRAREHRISHRLQQHGWHQVMRSAGSKGPADLAMVHPDHGLALIQVGTLRSKRLGPTERARFVELARLCSALPLVALARPGQHPLILVATFEPPSKWSEWKAS